ncbi:VanZ family protein [Alkalihalobacterium chitinilyticum]|uniref:VanZ family protein n=1 Tax=Alkalihalobacterium chitinilyticum TaxID=2980103 RepID=A0ABT5VEY0_9BACI|nr:VanZ family protein [Alkalihalobacterium chitinilyticum]MDE5414019.1 VanZ family protein [Alkalihalobacterium chitinilyticum]
MAKWFSWTAVIAWMALIFYLSHQPATVSSELSSEVTEVIIEIIETVAPNTQFEFGNLNHLVRKNAHFFAYLVLGLLTINALRRSGSTGYRSIGVALVICILYAITDEVHQLFIPGRSGEVRDVLIDTAGASVGIGLYWLFSRLRQKVA